MTAEPQSQQELDRRFIEEMVRLRDRITRARFMRVELPTSEIGRTLDKAFERRGGG
jgi:hypothetical protein